MTIRKMILLTLLPVAVAGCTSHWDMQGVDPKDYYAAHPIEPRIESRGRTHMVHYGMGESRLSHGEVNRLRSVMRGFAPEAVESVQVQMSEMDMRDADRKAALVRLLHNLGYDADVMFEPSATLARNDVQIAMTYAVALPPENCPDWRTSPVTTYSNTTQGNFRCANVTNIGLMVADPHDLKKGSGMTGGGDSERAARAIQQYRSGGVMTAAPAVESAASGESADAATPE